MYEPEVVAALVEAAAELVKYGDDDLPAGIRDAAAAFLAAMFRKHAPDDFGTG
jgi:predicted DNA-binding transcriptional regulator YafY